MSQPYYLFSIWTDGSYDQDLKIGTCAILIQLWKIIPVLSEWSTSSGNALKTIQLTQESFKKKIQPCPSSTESETQALLFGLEECKKKASMLQEDVACHIFCDCREALSKVKKHIQSGQFTFPLGNSDFAVFILVKSRGHPQQQLVDNVARQYLRSLRKETAESVLIPVSRSQRRRQQRRKRQTRKTKKTIKPKDLTSLQSQDKHRGGNRSRRRTRKNRTWNRKKDL